MTRLPYRTSEGVWVWWPSPRLGVVYREHFMHDIFSVRMGYNRIYHLGPFCIKWRPFRRNDVP